MIFKAIVGNPPYQELKKNGDYKSCYHKFWDFCEQVTDNFNLIIPARFLKCAGSLPLQWMQNWLANPHTDVNAIFYDTKKVFGKSVDIMGGVGICTYDRNRILYEKSNSNPQANSILKKVSNLNIDIFVKDTKLYNDFILVTLYEDFPNLKEIISSGGKEKRMVSNSLTYECFHDNPQENDIKIYGILNNKRCYKYISQKYIDLTHPNLRSYTVLVPAANGCPQLCCGQVTPILGKPFICNKNEGCSQSFLSIANFDTIIEAENCLKYIKTKFCRFLIGLLKGSQDNRRKTWKYVPNQDFTKNSDIDWTKSIHEIDEQLYKKYNLSKDEITFIEENIKEMV